MVIMSKVSDLLNSKKDEIVCIQVKLPKALHLEIGTLLKANGLSWQDLLLASVLDFKEGAVKTRKAK